MLQHIRKYAKGFLAILLFGMLILSFGLWGIGDIFRSHGQDETVARIGSEKISLAQFNTELQREVRRIAPAFGGQFDTERARQFGLFDRLLDHMVNRAILDQGARRLGLVVSDSAIAQLIQNEPGFRNEAGNFERARFDAFLANNQMSEGQFVALLKGRIARDQLAEAIATGGAAPSALIDPVFTYRMERRTAEILSVPRSAFVVSDPDAAALEAFYKERQKAFMAPEYRSLTVVTFTVDELAKGQTVPEERLREEYEARASEFETGETRTVEQFIAPAKDKADAAMALLKQGKDFAAASKAATGGAPLGVGDVTKASLDVQSPELAAAVFGLTAPGVAGPVETPFGFHVLRVTKITPARKRTFEEVRAQLAHQVAREQAVETLDKAANKFEDELAGGASIEDAAKTLGLPVIKVAAVDASGRDPKGEPVKTVRPEMVKAGFVTEAGRDSALARMGDAGYFMVRVESVTPPAPKPLADVRTQAIAAWKEEQRDKQAKEKAQAFLEKAKAGGDLAAMAAGERGARVFLPAPFLRTGADPHQALTAQISGLLFDSKPNDVVMGATEEGYAVARLKTVIRPDAKSDPAGYDQVRQQLRAATGGDLIASYATWLRGQLKVETRPALFDKLTQR